MQDALFEQMFLNINLAQLCRMRPPSDCAPPQRALQHLASLQSAYMGTILYNYIIKWVPYLLKQLDIEY